MAGLTDRAQLTVVAVIGGMLLVAGTLAFHFRGPDLQLTLGIVGAIVAVLGWLLNVLQRMRRRPAGSTPDEVEEARKTLVSLVRNYWHTEVEVRHLRDPEPLVVRWRLSEPDVMDHPDIIVRRGRLRFAGRTDDAKGFVRAFLALDRRRLVILGEPGMGKTTLAVLMLCELLDNHAQKGDLVPVFFSLSDWRVGSETFVGWLERRLLASYPSLRAVDFGPSAARELARSRYLVPILDGLDELSEETRARALSELNRAAGRPLIVTSRTREYLDALRILNGKVLRAAAVIEPEPLDARDIEVYLRRYLKTLGGSWPDLLSRLAGWPLAEALKTPLRLWLLRKVYIDRNADPAELCNLDTPEAIRDKLLDNLVRSLIEEDKEAKAQHGRKQADALQLTTRHTWNAVKAQQWLGFLADYVTRSPTRNLRWWDVHQDTRSAIRRLRVLVGVIAGVVFGLALSPRYAGVFGCLGGVLFLFNQHVNAEPRYADVRLAGRARGLPVTLLNVLSFTLPLGAVTGVIFYFIVGLQPAVMVGLTYAIIGGLLFTLSDSIAAPSVSDDHASTPYSTLRADRAMTGVHIVAVGVTNMIALGLAFGLQFGVLIAITFALVGSIGTEIRLPLPGGKSITWAFGFTAAGSAWAIYQAARMVLAVKKRTPVRLMTFLDDCYRLGLLRQEGPFYQFRHDEVQQRLASLHSKAALSSATASGKTAS